MSKRKPARATTQPAARPAASLGATRKPLPLLPIALFISLALHAYVLAVHFVPAIKPDRMTKALDIILVNSRSANKPANAQALAQAALDGGGNTDEQRRISTPLPPTLQQTEGGALEQTQRRVQELEARQRLLASDMKNRPNVAPLQNDAQQKDNTPTVDGRDLAQQALAMARLEGEISKSVDQYNQRPRKTFLSPRTMPYAAARYLEDWRVKVERVGNLNYPPEARGKLYGTVQVWVELRADGSIYNLEVRKPSGSQVLDAAALRIVRLSAPFGQVPPAALAGGEIIGFLRTMSFTQGDSSTVQ